MGLVYTWFDHTGESPLEIVFSSRIRVKWNTGRRGDRTNGIRNDCKTEGKFSISMGPNIESVTALTGEDAAEKTRICQRVFEAFWYAEKIQPAGNRVDLDGKK